MNIQVLPSWAGMQRLILRLGAGVMLAIMVLSWSGMAFAEEARKVKSGDQPQYPDLAKQYNMRGTVRLELLVTAEGSVKDIKTLGGNPVLVRAAIDAVKKWKYQPAHEDSTLTVQFDFKP